jgi:hypothetical protein
MATFTEFFGVVETEIGCRCRVALADLLESACDVAVTVTSAADATDAGAVYSPEALTTPHVPSEHEDRLHVTDVFVVPVTVTVNWWESAAPMSTDDSERLTFTGTSFTVAEPVLEVSDCSVATTVTLAALGIRDGAVYKPLVSMVPQAAPVHPVRLQTTAVEVVPVTVAVNCWVAPAMS